MSDNGYAGLLAVANGWKARAETAEAERDALAAHVEAAKPHITAYCNFETDAHEFAVAMAEWKKTKPTTSLARRDAEQQKIGAASFKAELQEASILPVRVHAEGVFAVWLRRQAEEGE